MGSRRAKKIGNQISGKRCRHCGRIGCQGGIKCQAIADAKMDKED